MAWIYRAAAELYNELLQKHPASTWSASSPCRCRPSRSAGSRSRSRRGGLKGLKYRTVGLAADLFQEMGAKVTQLPGGEIVPALERGVIDAFEFNNPTSDMRFGAQDVIKNYMMGSYHQAMEFFEIVFNKKKYELAAGRPAGDPALRRRGGELVELLDWRWTTTRATCRTSSTSTRST
jgi:TRAP-type mannitol/chloroaromatic compound transport system substrate-binding protein